MGVNAVFCLISYSLMLRQFGAAIAEKVFHSDTLQSPAILILGTHAALNVLCLPSTFSALRYTSLFGNVFLAYIMYAIWWRGGYLLDTEGWQDSVVPLGPDGTFKQSPAAFAPINIGYCGAVACLSSAFMCHSNGAMMFAEFKKRTVRRWNVVSMQGIAYAAILFTLVALLGYLPLTNHLKSTPLNAAGEKQVFGGNILNTLYHFDKDGQTPLGIALVMFYVMIMLTFPITFTTMRKTLLSFMNEFERSRKWSANLKYYAVTEIVLVMCIGVSFLNPGLTMVLKLKGSIAGPFIMAIMPCLIFLKVHKVRGKFDTCFCYFVLPFSVVCGILGIVNAFMQ